MDSFAWFFRSSCFPLRCPLDWRRHGAATPVGGTVTGAGSHSDGERNRGQGGAGIWFGQSGCSRRKMFVTCTWKFCLCSCVIYQPQKQMVTSVFGDFFPCNPCICVRFVCFYSIKRWRLQLSWPKHCPGFLRGVWIQTERQRTTACMTQKASMTRYKGSSPRAWRWCWRNLFQVCPSSSISAVLIFLRLKHVFFFNY